MRSYRYVLPQLPVLTEHERATIYQSRYAVETAYASCRRATVYDSRYAADGAIV